MNSSQFHLTTRSARASRFGGMVRPISFAVLRLITRWNFVVDCAPLTGDKI